MVSELELGTRKTRIDPRLRAVGWPVLVQAERYAKGVRQVPMYQDEFGVPFLYSTNGEVVWFHHVRDELNRSRRVAGFHTPTALAELLARDVDAEFRALASLPQNPRMRRYQVEANTAVEQAIRDRKRKLLWFNSPRHGRSYFEDCIFGAGRPHLSFDQLKASPVALPPLAEQREIVRRVEQLVASADRVQQQIEAAAHRVSSSSQAVLAKAFRGEPVLVPS